MIAGGIPPLSEQEEMPRHRSPCRGRLLGPAASTAIRAAQRAAGARRRTEAPQAALGF
jgi:hypothetical protein